MYQNPYQLNTSNIIWIKENEVPGFMVAPNNAVALWDSEKQVIYIKQADITGRPSIKIVDYTTREETKEEKNDFSELRSEIEELRKQLENLKKGKKKNEQTISESDAE